MSEGAIGCSFCRVQQSGSISIKPRYQWRLLLMMTVQRGRGGGNGFIGFYGRDNTRNVIWRRHRRYRPYDPKPCYLITSNVNCVNAGLMGGGGRFLILADQVMASAICIHCTCWFQLAPPLLFLIHQPPCVSISRSSGRKINLLKSRKSRSP